MRELSVRLRNAAVEGLVFATKWSVALLVPALLLYALAGDYAAVRAAASKGAAAYEFIEKAQAAQAKQSAAPAEPAK